MFYTVYESGTGKVLWSGSCADEDFEKQEVPAGCSILNALAKHDIQYVDPESKDVVDIPNAPSEFHDWDVLTKQWVQKNTTEILNILWSRVRFIRDRMLAECDWTQLPDVSEQIKANFASYRQELRDVTGQSNPTEITWPIPPAGWTSKVLINY